MIIGYTSGVFDLFHVGHLNILRNARSVCDKLIVGVSTDELVGQYKNKKPIINEHERMQIVSSIRYVDAVIPQLSMNKFEVWEKVKFDIIVVGDDWKGTEKWNEIELNFKSRGVRVVYFPYTKGTSSTKISSILDGFKN